MVDEKGTSQRLYSILILGKDAGALGAELEEQQRVASEQPSSGGPQNGNDELEYEAGSSNAQKDEAGTTGGGEQQAGAATPVGSELAGGGRGEEKPPPAAAAGEETATAAEGHAQPSAKAIEMRRLSSTASMPADAEVVPPTPEHERVERDREAFIETICTEATHPEVRRMIRRLYINGQLSWPAAEKVGKEKRRGSKLLPAVSGATGATEGEAASATSAENRQQQGAGGDGRETQVQAGGVVGPDGGGGGGAAEVGKGAASDGGLSESRSDTGIGDRSVDVQVANSNESNLAYGISSPSSRGQGDDKAAENEEARLKRYLLTRTKEQDDWVKEKVSEMVAQVHQVVNHRMDTDFWDRLQSRGVLDEEANRLRLKNMKRQELRKELEKHMKNYLKYARLEALKEWEDRQARGVKNVEVEEKEGETEMVFRSLTKPTVANDPRKRSGQVPKFPPLKMTYSLPVDWRQRSAAFGLS